MFLNILELEEVKSWDAGILAAIIALLGTLLVNIATNIVTIIQNKKARKDNNNKIKRLDIDAEKKLYVKKLNNFYIPLRHYLENSKTLFKIFLKDKPTGFRTLTYLLKPNQKYNHHKVKLDKNDKALLDRIFKIGLDMEKLILKNGYLAGDDPEFVENYIPKKEYSHIPYEKDMTLLSLLISHLTVIRMAYKADLSGQMGKFKGFVFPNEINPRVEEKIKELQGLISECETKMNSLLK